MIRIPSNRRTCAVPECGAHFWPWRRGPHLACELVIAKPGATLGAVYRRLHLDGRRDAYVRVFDGGTWSERLPLPPRPRKVWQPAVRRARAWVADRDGSGMALPSGSAEGAANARVRRTRTREKRREPAHAA